MSGAVVEIDLHGMTKDEARAAVNMFLKQVDSGTYRVKLIHGYNRGTGLRDMILSAFRSHPKVKRIEPGENQGITVLIIREY